MKSFILMVQFLTRLPININMDADESDFNRGGGYFTLVGLIIGIILYGASIILLRYVNYYLLSAIILVALNVLITGGIHLDGLADSFDGLYSYRDKDRILEIMKDSRVGTNGVLAIIFDIILRVALMSIILEYFDPKLIILMPVFGRLGIVLASRFSKYARENGMGGFFIGNISIMDLFFNLLVLVIAVFIVISFESLIFFPYSIKYLILLIIPFIYIRHCNKIIGGMTGDTLGCLCEIMEISFLMLCIIWG